MALRRLLLTDNTHNRVVADAVQGVSKGTLTVGDAVLFLSLLQQLYAPLNYFGSYYRCDRCSLSAKPAIDCLSARPCRSNARSAPCGLRSACTAWSAALQ